MTFNFIKTEYLQTLWEIQGELQNARMHTSETLDTRPSYDKNNVKKIKIIWTKNDVNKIKIMLTENKICVKIGTYHFYTCRGEISVSVISKNIYSTHNDK